MSLSLPSFLLYLKFNFNVQYLTIDISYVQNFGLYGERVGALSVVTSSPEEKERVLSQVLFNTLCDVGCYTCCAVVLFLLLCHAVVLLLLLCAVLRCYCLMCIVYCVVLIVCYAKLLQCNYLYIYPILIL